MGSLTPDRVTGAAIAALGMFFYFVFIPANVETVDAQWLEPESYPNVLAVFLSIFGAALMLLPSTQHPPNAREFGMALVFMITLAVGFYTLSHFGFMITAPLFALVIMLVLGERRIFWLIGGVVMMPLTIWICVVELLGRSLP